MNDATIDRLRASVPIETPGVWIVGGAVRDALLGRPPREFDLVVEGDAVAVGRSLGDLAAVHERFGTATVITPQGTIDLAAARREVYPEPGALPDVELGVTIEEDLLRRDFTVNAMAVHLADGRFVAVTGAEQDLAARILRVLHDGSFVDDPTRMLRLARYAARLGFEPEERTRGQVRPELLETVSGSRMGAELRLMLAEEDSGAALDALQRFALGAVAVHPAFSVQPGHAERLSATAPALTGVRTDLVLLAAGCQRVPPIELHERLDALGFEARERDLVVRCVQRADGLAAALEDCPDRVRLWRLAHDEPPEVVLLAGVRGPRDVATEWLTDLRFVRPQINGDVLVAAGLSGPAVGEALRRATEVAIAGADREAQLRAALEGA